MDYNDNQNQNSNGNSGNAQQDWTQQNVPQRPVVVDELANKKDSMVAASLVLGILGILFCWVLCVPIILSLIGLIMGIVCVARTTQHRGVAVAGIITSAIGLVVGVLTNFLYILLS